MTLLAGRLPRLIMISGPIASGKSTLAASLAASCRAEGFTVALTDLDTIAEMALPTLPDWEWAHAVHASLVGSWLATDIDLVIDEGTETRQEVEQILGQVPADTETYHVVLTADFEASLARAQSDPTRGISREPEFLRRMHDRFRFGLPDLPCDLQIWVEGHTVDQLVAHVRDHLAQHPVTRSADAGGLMLARPARVPSRADHA